MKKKTHSQRIKEGIAAAKKARAATTLDQKPLSAPVDNGMIAGEQSGTQDQGFEKGLRVGVNRAIGRVLWALGEIMRDGY